ncbi:TfoX/Sxy family protein [Streptomyces yangpuensis]|uniref:TfoX/Sxy family protein n=1 Tax=Streptomyces yangpuensis TaxID=1648182 RepID=UPI003827CC77
MAALPGDARGAEAAWNQARLDVVLRQFRLPCPLAEATAIVLGSTGLGPGVAAPAGDVRCAPRLGVLFLEWRRTISSVTYDEGLAQRIRERIGERPDLTEKRMFGGLSFLLHGNMTVGVVGDELIARVGPDRTERALARPEARPMDFTGRPMRGWVTVSGPRLAQDAVLEHWITVAAAFADTLPPK